MRRIAFFEDELTQNFSPIALLRPVFELRCGHFSVRERVLAALEVNAWGALIRPELRPVYAESQPNCPVNDESWLRSSPVTLLNGRWLSTQQSLSQIADGTAGWIDDHIAWLHVAPDDFQQGEFGTTGAELQQTLLKIARTKKAIQAEGTLVQYPWDLIFQNGTKLQEDFSERGQRKAAPVPHQCAIVGKADQAFIDPTAEVDPFVVLDTLQGPIWIDAHAKIQAFTRIEGPAYIGTAAQTFRANIREGTSIGPVCRVGGEVEESILHGHANKYHDGFLGHSYVCPWVNLGALTSNSDLKNDYSNVSVPLTGESIHSESNKVGCFIGDHTKTALCSIFNTGSSIGVGCLILPGGELLPKHVPSFSRIWHGQLEPLPGGAHSTIATARIAMQRRDQTLTPAMEQLLTNVCESTEQERAKALKRQAERSAS